MADQPTEVEFPHLADVLFVDLELAKSDARLRRVGAVLGREVAEGSDLSCLDPWKGRAALIGNHNLLDFDGSALRARDFWGSGLPGVDSLVLSPLSHPQRPYHRLIKDDKLLRTEGNNPVADARQSRLALHESLLALARLPPERAVYAALYRVALRERASGFEVLFDRYGLADMPETQIWEVLGQCLVERSCATTFARLQDRGEISLDLAYAVAWLSVEGTGSVLPPWVWKRHQGAAELLDTLRARPCGACARCRQVSSPEYWLQRFFGFPNFRASPSAADGTSLQRQIVNAGISGRPSFNILPTGGGKSICFQIPALAAYHLRGRLTVVISPLQSLMKDQVDSLITRSITTHAAVIHGALFLWERAEVMNRVAMGEVGLLYLSPEQLRNPNIKKLLSTREIGAWVFDEAHCLSNWGHDFRTDYLYAPRFIRELAEPLGRPPPPVHAFTATARRAVVEEVCDLVRHSLDQELLVLDGGVERTNLQIRVERVAAADKLGHIDRLLREHLPDGASGAAIVFTPTRRLAEERAESLAAQGWRAAGYHAGLEPQTRREVQDRFLSGELQVIAATSAFGMGVDKSDVRLVIHESMPGSLEAYLQEAGRAGRDGLPAVAVLLYDPSDFDHLCHAWGRSRLLLKDVQSVLQVLRKCLPKRNETSDLWVTAGEICRLQGVSEAFDPELREAETRVKTSLSWLEKAEFLQREENRTQALPVAARVGERAEFDRIVRAVGLPPETELVARRLWARLQNVTPGEGLSTEDLAEVVGLLPEGDGRPETVLEVGRRLIQLVIDLSQTGLFQNDQRFVVRLHHGVQGGARERLSAFSSLDRLLVETLAELEPDAQSAGRPLSLHLRGLFQRLLSSLSADEQKVLDERALSLALENLGADGESGRNKNANFRIQSLGHNERRLVVVRGWTAINVGARLRREAAQRLLDGLIARLPTGARGKDLVVEVSLEELFQWLAGDIRLQSFLRSRAPHEVERARFHLVERAMLWMHSVGVINLQAGVTLFRQAMHLRIHRKSGSYTRSHHRKLETYEENRLQAIHTMGRFAQVAADGALGSALTLAKDWFTLSNPAFLARWFPGEGESLARPCSRAVWDRVVNGVAPGAQREIVQAKEEANLVVLAGPGAGKTRVLVHRVAYLVLVRQVRAEGIFVLCYNRATVAEIRGRLQELIGRRAAAVRVCTLHGLAVSLLGRPPDLSLEDGFGRILADLREVLEGRSETELAVDAHLRLLGSASHLLIDEFQDLDEVQYGLVRSLAGRLSEGQGGEQEAGRRLAVFAVGDDDQSIYAFRGASSRFMREFERDFGAQRFQLERNYRSTPEIVAAAAKVLVPIADRLKVDLALVSQRQPGEPVRRLVARSRANQVWAVVEQVRGRLSTGARPESLAVLARTRRGLDAVHAHLRARGIPVRWPLRREDRPNLLQIREIYLGLSRLRALGPILEDRDALARRVLEGASAPAEPWLSVASPLVSEPPPRYTWFEENPWMQLLQREVGLYVGERAPGQQPAQGLYQHLREALWEEKAELRVGHGVVLSTLHGAKGLEFDEVFVLDDRGASGQSGPFLLDDEERRLLYVGMTRARDRLWVCDAGGRNLWDPTVVPPMDVGQRPVEGGTGALSHAVIGPREVWLDAAGVCGPEDPIHAQIASTPTGARVRLVREGERVRIEAGGLVGRLSKEGAATWIRRLDLLREVRVLAWVHRKPADLEPKWREKMKVEEWEYPVLSVWWADGGDSGDGG